MIMQPRAARGGYAAVGRVDQARGLASTDDIDAHVGGRLRARRTELGLSQGTLGQHLGLTFSQVQKYEKGTNRIGAGRLYHLAALLGVSVPYFFEGLEGSQPGSPRASTAAVEAAQLQEVFVRISDPQARQALMSLASSMVEGT
jgi:transcriptional regulator with XRE-family HTH domain